MSYPLHLLKLIEVLKKLPGVGKKSAERFAFELLSWESYELNEAADVLRDIPKQLVCCSDCGCLGSIDSCAYCSNPNRFSGKMCLVASPRDVFFFEETGEYKGLYHVLGHLLSPIEGINPSDLNLGKLIRRIEAHQIEEVIIAIDSTLEGDATSLYIKQELQRLPNPPKITRLAFGLPMGSSLDYVDGSTLAHALQARNHF